MAYYLLMECRHLYRALYFLANPVVYCVLDFGPIRAGQPMWKLRAEVYTETAHSRNSSESVALAAGICAGSPSRGEAQARSSYTSLRSFGAGDSAAGDLAYSRDGVSRCENRRFHWWPAQLDARQHDRTGDRDYGLTGGPIHVGQGFHRGGDRDELIVHVGCIVLAWRTPLPCPGIQSHRSTYAGRSSVSRHRCAPHSFRDRITPIS